MVSENENRELDVNYHSKRKSKGKQTNLEQFKIDLQCPPCKQGSVIEFKQGYFCENCG